LCRCTSGVKQDCQIWMVASHHFRIIRQAHCSTVCFAHGIFGGRLLGMFDWHFDLFSILISRNWRSHQARSFTLDIIWRTQNRVAHKVWKICPYWGTLNYFHFGRGFYLVALFGSLLARFGILIAQNCVHVKLALWLSTIVGNLISRNRQAHCSTVCFAHGIFGGHVLGMFDWHFDLFSILISRNWRSRQARSFTFDITWRTQNRVAHKVWKICPYWGTLNYFHFGRGFFLVALFSSLLARFGILIAQNCVHVKLALWLSTIVGNLISRNWQAHCSTVCFAHGIFGGHVLGMFD